MATTPRISPIEASELDDFQRELLDQVGGIAKEGPAANIFRTFVRHPGLFRRWLPFGGKLLAGRLSGRDRELLILRTAFHCRAPYEWAQHVQIGLAEGLTAQEIAKVQDGPSSFDGRDAALLRAADELHTQSQISDSTWAELADGYDDKQLIEVPMVVGHYHLVAFTLNSLGVAPEEGLDLAGAENWD